MHLFEKREKFKSRGLIISILLFGLIIALFISMLGQIEMKSGDEQTKIMEDALYRAAVTCYAIEGRYPPSVQYIIDNFAVVVDEEKYIVSYNGFASNVMPDITVLRKGAASK
jgi:hypothetical protein